MSVEEGICPKTGEICDWRAACVAVRDDQAALLSANEPLRRALQDRPRRRRLAENLGAALTAYEIQTMNEVADDAERTLARICVGDDCIVENELSGSSVVSDLRGMVALEMLPNTLHPVENEL